MPSFKPDKNVMRAALAAARKSFDAGDYAVGSAISSNGELLIAKGNRTHLDGDPTLHAEMIVIREAARILGSKNLSECVLYATHEPCPMCMGAIVWARIPIVVYGATMVDHKAYRDTNASEKWKWRVVDVSAQLIAESGDPQVHLVPGFMRDECNALFHC